MTSLTIILGEPLFSFRSKAHWIEVARWYFEEAGVTNNTAICVDKKGRIVQRGEHFARAEADGSYPITAYRIQADAEAMAAAT